MGLSYHRFVVVFSFWSRVNERFSRDRELKSESPIQCDVNSVCAVGIYPKLFLDFLRAPAHHLLDAINGSLGEISEVHAHLGPGLRLRSP